MLLKVGDVKILVLGSYYSPNLGDGVLCECVASRLAAHFPTAEIVVGDVLGRQCFRDGERFQLGQLKDLRRRVWLREWVYRLLRWDKQLEHEEYRLRAMAQGLDQVCAIPADLVVFAGGQMFMDAYALPLERCVQTFSQRQVPMIFNACGVGPAYSESIRHRLKAALEDPWVRLVSTRDDAQLMDRRYFQDRRTVVTCDPALWCAEVYGIQRDEQADTIGLGIMFARSVSTERLIRFWVRLIRALECRGIKWKVFVNGDPGDVCLARHILSRIPELSGREEACLAPVPARPRELVETISHFRSLISFRLHSHIIAASLGIPTAAVVWDSKLNFFFEKIGCPERCCPMQESPDGILRTLAQAELEGYSTPRLMEQKQFADILLREAVEREAKRMSL